MFFEIGVCYGKVIIKITITILTLDGEPIDCGLSNVSIYVRSHRIAIFSTRHGGPTGGLPSVQNDGAHLSRGIV